MVLDFPDPYLEQVGGCGMFEASVAQVQAETAVLEAVRRMTEELFSKSVTAERVENYGEDFPYTIMKVTLDKGADPLEIAKKHSEWHDRLVEIDRNAVLSIRLNVAYV